LEMSYQGEREIALYENLSKGLISTISDFPLQFF